MRRPNIQPPGKLILIAAVSAAGLIAVALGLGHYLIAPRPENDPKFNGRADLLHGGEKPRQVVPPDAARGARLVPQPAPTDAAPKLQGKPAGEVLPLEYPEKDLMAAVLAQPMPEVWLEFHRPHEQSSGPPPGDGMSGDVVKARLPRGARKMLEGLWREACLNSYEALNTQDINTKKNLASAMTIANTKASYALQEVIIKAPDGSRGISTEEATGLVRYLGESA